MRIGMADLRPGLSRTSFWLTTDGPRMDSLEVTGVAGPTSTPCVVTATG